MNWIQKVVAGSLIEKLEVENKRLTNLIVNYDMESYDRNARIGMLEDDLQSKANELIIAEQAYQQKNTEYQMLMGEHEGYVTEHQKTVKKLDLQIVDLKKLQNETSLKLTETMSQPQPRTRKKKVE